MYVAIRFSSARFSSPHAASPQLSRRWILSEDSFDPAFVLVVGVLLSLLFSTIYLPYEMDEESAVNLCLVWPDFNLRCTFHSLAVATNEDMRMRWLRMKRRNLSVHKENDNERNNIFYPVRDSLAANPPVSDLLIIFCASVSFVLMVPLLSLSPRLAPDLIF